MNTSGFVNLTRGLNVERAGSDLPPHLVAAHAADGAVIKIRLCPENGFRNLNEEEYGIARAGALSSQLTRM